MDSVTDHKLRSRLHELQRAGEYALVLELILTVSPADDPGVIQDALTALEKVPAAVIAAKVPLQKRLAILGGATTQFLVPLIRLFALRRGVSLSFYESDFGVFEQEIWSSSPTLLEFGPDLIHFHLSSRNLALTVNDDSIDRHIEEETQRFVQLYRAASERFSCPIVANNFEAPVDRPYGSLEGVVSSSRTAMIRAINSRLTTLLPEQVFLHDIEWLSAKHGKSRWFDQRLWHVAKSAVSFECQPFYADSLAAQIAALFGKSKKCLVLDLDNTLWGGVVGDDGLAGIQLGAGHPSGEAFQDFQRYLKSLKDRGILLAVASKNERETALAPFREHADMILREPDISCFVAHWEPKDRSVIQIAEELNIGLDSIVFFDDNPAERALVRASLPTVTVLEVPEDPALYIESLDDANLFDTLVVTDEDRRRTSFFKEEGARVQLQRASLHYDDYLRQLKMEAVIEPIHKSNLARVTQLINKTNQFNLTTRRMTEADVQRIATDPQSYTRTVRLIDRFGDHGLISVVIGHISGWTLEIDNWLMSCRVLKRGVEQLAFDDLLAFCRDRSLTEIHGYYIPTAKNKLVEGHFAALGFSAGPIDGKCAKWIYDCRDGRAPMYQIEIRKGD
jgi:FkbH-like protein